MNATLATAHPTDHPANLPAGHPAAQPRPGTSAGRRLRRLGAASTGPIGIDVGARAVKIAQLRQTPGGDVLERALILHRVTLEDPAPDAPEAPAPAGTVSLSALAGILERQGFRGNRVVIGAPEQSISGMVAVPPAAPDARLELAKHESARAYNFDPDSVEVAAWEVHDQQGAGVGRASRDGVEMMVVGVDHGWGLDRVQRFRDAGLELAVLDAPCLARARGLGPSARPDEGLAILDMGWSRLTFIACVAGRVVYERRVESQGWGRYVSRLASELGSAERVAELVMRTVGLENEGVLRLVPGSHDTDSPGGPALRIADDPVDRRRDVNIFEGVRPVNRMVHEYAEMLGHEFSAAMKYVTRRHPEAESWRFSAIGGAAGCPGVCQHFRDTVGLSGHPVRVSDLVRTTPASARYADSTELTSAIGLARRTDA